MERREEKRGRREREQRGERGEREEREGREKEGEERGGGDNSLQDELKLIILFPPLSLCSLPLSPPFSFLFLCRQP